MANAILNVLRGTAFTGIATPFVELHTADPGASGVTAVSVGSTTRNAVAWNAASAGSMTLLTLGAWTNGGTTETISDIAIFSAATVGTFYQSMQLSVAQAWVSTNTLTITTLSISYSPLAA
jgi:hypothetical protein